MKTFYSLLICFLFFSSITSGQCPIGDLYFSSQEEVDSFLVNYPNCKETEGDIIITEGVITDANTLNFKVWYSTIESLGIRMEPEFFFYKFNI